MFGRMKLKSRRIAPDHLGSAEIRGAPQIARPYARKHSVQVAADTSFLSQAFAACQYAQATELTPYDINKIQGDTKSPLREGLRRSAPSNAWGKECISIISRIRIRERLQSKNDNGA